MGRHCVICEQNGIETRATYGNKTGEPFLCKSHKEEHFANDKTIFDVIHSLCITCAAEGIQKRADFGEEGKPPQFCSAHSGDTKNLTAKMCKSCNETIACYGTDWQKPKYCAPCAKEIDPKLKNVVSPRCIECSNSRRRYGYSNDGIPLYCKKCAEEKEDFKKMKVLISIPKCISDGCNTTPSWGYKEDKKALYCASCAKNHPDEAKLSDVKNSKCIQCKKKQPTFGSGNKPTHCVDCIDKSTMTDARHPICKAENCTKRSTFGSRKNRPQFCAAHNNDGLPDVLNPICTNCNITSANRNYKPLCAYCYYELNPEEERTINFKTKEFAFINGLKEHYPNIIQDRKIKGGSSKRRPDGLLELDNHYIVIEIDEGQHSCYTEEIELNRLLQIQKDLNDQPIIVIRINPDGYNKDNKRIRGCFTKSKKTNKLELNNFEFNKRMKVLFEVFENAVANTSDKKFEIIRLFYTTKTATDDTLEETMGKLSI